VDVSDAEIEGEPIVGLEARVEGIIVDDDILASKAWIKEAEKVKFEGIIETIVGAIWTMTDEGETMTVDVSDAEIEGEPIVGLEAKVEGIIVDDDILASKAWIKEVEEEEFGEEEFNGTILDNTDDAWTIDIGGVEWTVDVSEADIEGDPAVGLEVEVKGIVVDDTIVASRVEIKVAEEEELEFEGTIDNIEGTIWTMTIGGETKTVDVSEADIEGDPAVGLEVEVKGTVVDDTIVASRVEVEEDAGGSG
ncbi:DUF5666 domain-containing protein, partial [Chloroflexota bacterium]